MLGSLFPFSQCEIAIFVTFNIFATSVCVKFCSMRNSLSLSLSSMIKIVSKYVTIYLTVTKIVTII